MIYCNVWLHSVWSSRFQWPLNFAKLFLHVNLWHWLNVVRLRVPLLLSEILGSISLNFWVGVCRWDSETLTLYQTMFSCILQLFSRLDTKNPYPIPDSLTGSSTVHIMVTYRGKWKELYKWMTYCSHNLQYSVFDISSFFPLLIESIDSNSTNAIPFVCSYTLHTSYDL